MKEKSYAKLNIALNVTNKSKPSNFHDLDMLNICINLYDVIDIKFVNDHKKEILISCNNKDLSTDEDNLIYKVVEKFIKQFNLDYSFEIKLTKNIPMQAGLGGGSSNAATTLNMLDKFFKTNMSFADKIKFLDSLTSDGPYFIETKPAKVKGKGNIVNYINGRINHPILIVKPNSGCDTKTIFSLLNYNKLTHPNMYKIEKAFEKNDFDTLANHIDNSLTDSAIKVNLDILDTINRLRACGFEIVSMTGSGSTVFAISNRKLPYKLYKKVLNKENYEIIKIVNQI